MRKLVASFFFILFTAGHALGAGNHAVVPGTEGNTLTLEIANRSEGPMRSLVAMVISKPSWVEVTRAAAPIQLLPQDSTAEASFTFDMAAEIQAGTEGTILIDVMAGEKSVGRQRVLLVVAVPQAFALSQNFPNPFNPSTQIRYEVPEASRVSLSIYDILGREVARLFDEEKPAGYFVATWDGITSAGSHAASGVYFYRMQARSTTSDRQFQSFKKLMIVK